MLGQFIAVMMAIALWPLLVQSFILTIFVVSLLIQLPRLYHRYRFEGEAAKWLWLTLVVALILVSLGTYMVYQAPFSNWPSSLDPKPIALAGLFLSAWSTFAWVVATEWISAAARHREESLLEAGENVEAYLGPLAA